MLVLTENAVSVIRGLTERPDIPDGSGVRIAPADAGNGALELSLQTAPSPGDEIIDSEGARVFIEPSTAVLLSDQTLDAQPEEQGAGFYLTNREE